MAPTFYGVLGVGPDADAQAIERGYRERVTEVHPDVTDDPDADAQFKRLTTARDTLLDADERARYDRLGHASYVRHHVSCSAWESTVSGRAPAGDDDTRSSGRDDDPSKSTATPSESSTGRRRATRPGTSGRSRTRDWNTGHHRSDGEDATSTSRNGSGRSRDGTASATSRSTSTGGTHAATGGSGTSDETDSSGWSASAGRTGRRQSSTGHSGDSAGAGESTYASSSFWESQRVGQRFGSRSRTRDPLAVRLLRGIRALGVWALIHVAFLAAAVGTSWYVYVVILDASSASLPLLVVLVGEVVLAAVLSSIHVATRVYR